MEIRKIKELDNVPLAQLIRTSLEKHQLDIPGTAYFDPQLDDLYHFYAQIPDACYWVLVDHDDKVLGGVGVAPFEDKIAELQKLYLRADVIGKGYGRQLLRHAMAFAQQHYEALYLETSSLLPAAQQLYLKNGFNKLARPLGATGHETMDCWMMICF